MATEYGDNHARLPDFQNGSPNSDSGTGMEEESVSRLLGYSEVTFDVIISMHLLDCDQCRKAIAGKPVGIGQKTGLCDVYLQLQLLRAQEEGRVNNVVAYTEYGDEAKKGRGLE